MSSIRDVYSRRVNDRVEYLVRSLHGLLLFLTMLQALPVYAGADGGGDAAGPLILFRDPETGVISNEPAPGHVALGTFVSAERLAAGLATAAALEARLAAVEARLLRVEASATFETMIPGELAVAGSAVEAAGNTAAQGVVGGPAASTAMDEPTAVAPRSSGTAEPVVAHDEVDRYPVRYARNALRFGDRSDAFSASVQTRVQMRYSTPFDTDPRSIADIRRDQPAFQLRRSRLKLKGHVLAPDLGWALQYDWDDAVLFDLYVDYAFSDALQLKLGRAKALFGAEYATSSGALSFANRSIIHDVFTVDRQQGLQLHGRLFADTPADLHYNFGLFTGRGMAERSNDDDTPMTSARLQWNALGGPMGFSHSDLAFTEAPQLSLAVAGVSNRSNCTAFATADESCRALRGFNAPEASAPGQFDLEQLMMELRFRWIGFSLDGELHRKEIEDRTRAADSPARRVELRGGFVQFGVLPHGLFPDVPPQLEFAMRYAHLDPDDDRSNDEQEEYAAAINWFIDGHTNKLTFEFANLSVREPIPLRDETENRVRLQWELSF